MFGRFATGVAVITSAGPGGAGGMTANALCSLSLDPLLALVCFENHARTLPIVREAGRFGVNVLSAEQEELAGVFASKLPESEKLEGVAHRFEGGVPMIEGALAWAVCELRELIAGGDHTIAIGEVVVDGPRRRASRCCGTRGRYHRVAEPVSRSPAVCARAQQQHDDHQRRERHHPELALHDRRDDDPLLVLGELPDRLGGLEPARVEHHLRRADPQLLGDQRRPAAAARRRGRAGPAACGRARPGSRRARPGPRQRPGRRAAAARTTTARLARATSTTRPYSAGGAR